MNQTLDNADGRIARFASKNTGGGGGGGGMGSLALGAVGGAGAALASAGIGAAVGLASKAGSAILDAIGKASDMNETLSKTGVIFGPAAKTIVGEADAMSASFGTSKNEYINAATSFGAVFKGMGKSQEEAAGLGNQIAKLGMDMASFDNASNSEVFTALQAGLRGEFDPLERFRVFLSAAKVEAKALEMGLAGSKKELDDNAKKTAMLALIMEQTKDAQGDLARTAGGAANQFRMSGGLIENLSTKLGTLLLPAVQSGVGAFNELLTATVAAFESNTPMFEAWGVTLKTTVDDVGLVVRNLPDIFAIGSLQIGEQILGIGAYFEAFATNVGNIGKWFGDNWVNLVVAGLGAVGSAFGVLAANIGGIWTGLSDMMQGKGFNFVPVDAISSFQASISALPAMVGPTFTSLQDQIDAKFATIAQREDARAKAMQGAGKAAGALVGPPVPTAAADEWGAGAISQSKGKSWESAAKNVKDYTAVAAVEVGSVADLSAIAKYRAGEGAVADKPIKDVAKSAKDQVSETRAMHLTLKQVLEKTGTNLAAYTI